MLKTLGATGLLIEYEDMFPFEHPIQKISAKNSYSRADIRELLQAATGMFEFSCSLNVKGNNSSTFSPIKQRVAYR